MDTFEVNFDGLVGPSHNYSGLSRGNIASETHGGHTSSPKKAALQGLKKMKALADWGLKQAVLPPHPRPFLSFFEKLGFAPDVSKVYSHSPHLVSTAYSSSFMWAANAATAAASKETLDGKVHITVANLAYNLHRSLESEITFGNLKQIFADESCFSVHAPLPCHPFLADEGAANHTRFCKTHGSEGFHLFVYGREGHEEGKGGRKYPARQTLEASQALSRKNQIKEGHSYFAKQNRDAIDEGVFHNDVISTGNENVFLCHEKAFEDTEYVLGSIRSALKDDFFPIIVPEAFVSVKEAVKTYLFNSQILTLTNKRMALICPKECEESKDVVEYLNEEIVHGKNPIDQVFYFDLKESMQNGGGPACLRFRVVLTEKELEKMHQGVLLTDSLYKELCGAVEEFYPETISPEELKDPELAAKCLNACDHIYSILGIN